MGRAPCCDKAKVKKGPWSPEEDAQLKEYIGKYGTGGNWIALPQKAGLRRCGKSCRLRWLNYLRPNIKHGEFSDEEDRIICTLFANIGSRWSIIAAQLPGRTDNDIKNYWNTKLKKKLMGMANYCHKPQLSHQKITANLPVLLHSPSPPSPLMLSPDLSSSSPYSSGGNYYNVPSSTLSFTGFDQSTLLTNSSYGLSMSASTILQSAQQEEYLSPPTMKSNYLVFGGAPEPSCSSSDGSSNVNTNNNWNSTQQYDHHEHQQHQSYNSYFYNGSSVGEEDQKMVINQNSNSLIWEETPPLMDYGLEEIKQLISTTSTTITSPNNSDYNNSNSFYLDENKTGERAMLYC